MPHVQNVKNLSDIEETVSILSHASCTKCPKSFRYWGDCYHPIPCLMYKMSQIFQILRILLASYPMPHVQNVPNLSDIEETISILSRNSRSTTPASEVGWSSSRTPTPSLGQFRQAAINTILLNLTFFWMHGIFNVFGQNCLGLVSCWFFLLCFKKLVI